ncbi:MAG: MarC family protein [Candidatus Aenigmarchaeota archaeon]|nr:MarC family protein [Candidatus Aenigmarchaeota archaeon]
MIVEFFKTFVMLFIIMGPFSSFVVFSDITKRFSKKQKLKIINKAVAVAGLLAMVFILGGNSIMDLFGVTMKSFTIVGGAVLFLLGLEMILSFKISKDKAKDYNVAALIIATPLTTGPGVITSVILFSNSIGIFPTTLSLLLSLGLIYVLLRGHDKICSVLGTGTIEIISKVVGIFIAARGVELILSIL